MMAVYEIKNDGEEKQTGLRRVCIPLHIALCVVDLTAIMMHLHQY